MVVAFVVVFVEDYDENEEEPQWLRDDNEPTECNDQKEQLVKRTQTETKVIQQKKLWMRGRGEEAATQNEDEIRFLVAFKWGTTDQNCQVLRPFSTVVDYFRIGQGKEKNH